MADLIEHCGVVERTERDTVYVRITSRSACGTCKARQACGLAEAQDKIVAVATPEAGQYAADDAFKAKWAQLIAVRDEVKKVLEQARAEKTIGASLEAAVTLYCNDAVYDLLNSIPMDELADLMIVSQVELVKGEGGAASAVEGLGVAAAHATGEKCERCWKYSASIGIHPAHPTLCARCASVVEA